MEVNLIEVQIRVPSNHSINVPPGTRAAVKEFLEKRGAKEGEYLLTTIGATKGSHRRKTTGVTIFSGNDAVSLCVQPGSNSTSRAYVVIKHPYGEDHDALRKVMLSQPQIAPTGSNAVSAVDFLGINGVQDAIIDTLGDSRTTADVTAAIQLVAEGFGAKLSKDEVKQATTIVKRLLPKGETAIIPEDARSEDERDPQWVLLVSKRGAIRGEGYARKFAERFGNSVFTSSDIFNCYAEYVKEEFGCKTPDATDHQRRFVAQLHTKAGLVYRISAKRPGYRVATSLLKSVNVPPDAHGLAHVATEVVAPRKDAKETQACDPSRHCQLEQMLRELLASAEGLRAEIDTEYAAIKAESEALERRKQALIQLREDCNRKYAAADKLSDAIRAIKEAEKSIS